MKILAFAASNREQSLNRKLINIAAAEAHKLGAQVDVVSFTDFDVPLFDGDHTNELPEGVLKFQKMLEVCDAFMIAAPEYNYSVSGRLKNLIDWASRIRPVVPYSRKPCLLISASTSMSGGMRGLTHLRTPLEGASSFVYPDMFALAVADKNINAEGTLITEPALMERLRRTVSGFVDFAKRLSRVT